MAEPARKAAVIGWPVEHSRSPVIHRAWLAELGLAGDYLRLAVPPQEIVRLKAILRDGGFAGSNVTIPHKEAAFRLADEADEIAGRLGAANTLWFEDERLCASNSDEYGFLANLDEGAPGWHAAGGAAVVLGAGGAARAIVSGLLRRGFAPVVVVNRTLANAEALAERFGSTVVARPLAETERALAGARLLANTSALGMHEEGELGFSLAGLSDDALVTDAVYTPLTTALLAAASARGLATVDGLGMLLHQAVPGFEKWFGVRPVVTPALRRAVLADLGEGA